MIGCGEGGWGEGEGFGLGGFQGCGGRNIRCDYKCANRYASFFLVFVARCVNYVISWL